MVNKRVFLKIINLYINKYNLIKIIKIPKVDEKQINLKKESIEIMKIQKSSSNVNKSWNMKSEFLERV